MLSHGTRPIKSWVQTTEFSHFDGQFYLRTSSKLCWIWLLIALVFVICLSSGSWITSSLWETDFACNLCPKAYPTKTSQSSYASLWYHLKTKHAIELSVSSDASQTLETKRTKVQYSLFPYSADGMKSKMLIKYYCTRKNTPILLL